MSAAPLACKVAGAVSEDDGALHELRHVSSACAAEILHVHGNEDARDGRGRRHRFRQADLAQVAAQDIEGDRFEYERNARIDVGRGDPDQRPLAREQARVGGAAEDVVVEPAREFRTVVDAAIR